MLILWFFSFLVSSGQPLPPFCIISLRCINSPRCIPREGKWKLQSQNKQNTIFCPSYTKKIAKSLGRGNGSHLPASEGGVPVCAVTLVKVFVQTLEVPRVSTLLADARAAASRTSQMKGSTGHHPALWLSSPLAYACLKWKVRDPHVFIHVTDNRLVFHVGQGH